MNKNVIQKRKFFYYLINTFSLFIPSTLKHLLLKRELKKIDRFDASYIETRVWSLFGEALLPISDNTTVTIGARHEDYGLDAITKPKLSIISDVTDKVTVRASYEQVFRVPPSLIKIS